MASKNDSGFSLLEITIALAILVIAGTMVSRYLIRVNKASQEITARGHSRDILMHNMQKLRKNMSIRNSSVAIVTQPLSLSFSVPLSSTSAGHYQVVVTTRCRALPAGLTLDLSRVTAGLACLQSINCSNGLPYIEWSYTGHPQLGLEEQPAAEPFLRELNKTYGSPGYGLCFTQTVNALTVVGLQVNLQADADPALKRRRTVFVSSESLVVPLTKRNHIELVP